MPDEFELDLTTDPKDPTVVSDKGGGEGVSGSAPGNKTVSAEDIDDLRKELLAAKDETKRAYSAKTEAERRSTEIERDSSVKLTSEIEKRIDEQEVTLTAALASAQSEIESARSLAAKAMEEGKWSEASEANEAMTDAKVRLRELTQQKGHLTRAREQVKLDAETAKTPKGPAVGNRTQDWIAKHPRFNTDPVYRATALLEHERAIAAGITPESDEYFQRVELATGDRKAEIKVEKTPIANGEGGDGAPPARAETPQSGVAPVTRRTPQVPNNAPGKIKLSGEQVEAADSLFGDPTSPLMYIKDPKERYTYWHQQQERLKSEGRLS